MKIFSLSGLILSAASLLLPAHAATVNRDAQTVADAEIKSLVDSYSPSAAYILISDAKTGNLLALGKSTAAPVVNEYTFEPGSVAKVVAYAAAIQEGVVKTGDTVDTTVGTVEWGGVSIQLPKDDRAVGAATVEAAFARSSNKAATLLAAQVVKKAGYKRWEDYLHAFGYGETVSVGNYAATSRIFSSADADPLSCSRSAYGHSLFATPVHIHRATAMIASGSDDGTHAVKLSPATLGELRKLMVGVCAEGGTATKACPTHGAVAGVSATTQKLVGKAYSSHHHIAVFTGFTPVESPKYVITVVVDDAKCRDGSVAYAGKVAAPAFKHIADALPE